MTTTIQNVFQLRSRDIPCQVLTPKQTLFSLERNRNGKRFEYRASSGTPEIQVQAGNIVSLINKLKVL